MLGAWERGLMEDRPGLGSRAARARAGQSIGAGVMQENGLMEGPRRVKGARLAQESRLMEARLERTGRSVGPCSWPGRGAGGSGSRVGEGLADETRGEEEARWAQESRKMEDSSGLGRWWWWC